MSFATFPKAKARRVQRDSFSAITFGDARNALDRRYAAVVCGAC